MISLLDSITHKHASCCAIIGRSRLGEGEKKVAIMAEYKLANGGTITMGDIERGCAEYEKGTWEGKLDRIHVGPAAVSEEPFVTVKFPASMVAAIDERSTNRSDYIRRAVQRLFLRVGANEGPAADGAGPSLIACFVGWRSAYAFRKAS